MTVLYRVVIFIHRKRTENRDVEMGDIQEESVAVVVEENKEDMIKV